MAQSFPPRPPWHFHQFAVALIVPLPMLSMPISPKNELQCAAIVEPATTLMLPGFFLLRQPRP